MKNIGRPIALATMAVVFVGVVPASTASAAPDVTGSVRAIAERAAELAAEEQALLELAADPSLDATARAELESDIRTVDARGVELLTQLDRLHVDVTQAIRTSLGPLAPADDRATQPALFVPAATVYQAAIADLERIAETPEAVSHTPTTSSSPAFGLLAVAAVSLLALGAAALGNSLRRHPDVGELPPMAWSDGLTGLGNRRRLDADLCRHDGEDKPTAAIVVAIDHFDEINDTYGHALGDEVLRRVGNSLARLVRYDDVVYRYSGEEFCVLLPGALPEDAEKVAARIMSAVRGIELPDGRSVTVSVGAAGARGDASDAVRRADQALLAAKERGPDRAVANGERAVGV